MSDIYWRHQYIDTTEYPLACPDCEAFHWQDEDFETGLVYCRFCSWYDGEDDAKEQGYA